jgi:hypothetical protein
MSDATDEYYPRDIKISEFVQKTAENIENDALLPFVDEGTNFTIRLDELIAKFGAIGTLEQLGEVTGVPVLKQTDTLNQIRNLLASKGMLTSLSPEDGILIQSNKRQIGTGATIIKDLDADQHEYRTLLGDSTITVTADGDVVRFSVTGVPVASNIVIVNEMADFPAAVSGVRTLNDNTAYLVSANLSTSDRFVLGNNCVVYGADSAVASLTYTSAGNMFTQTSGSAKVTLLTLAAPNGSLFDISGGGVFQFVNATVTSCDYCGDIGSMSALQITDVSFEDIKSGGFTFTGSVTLLVGERNLFVVNGGKMFDLNSSTWSAGWTMDASFAVLAAGTYFLSGLVDSGNMDVGATGSVLNMRFTGAGTPLENILQSDARWNMIANDNIPDSIVSILSTTVSNTVSISAANTPAIVGATWNSSHLSRFDSTAGGRFTYVGTGVHVNVHATVTANSPGTTNDYTFYFYKNGVQEAGSGVQRSFTSAPGNISMLWQIDLETDDYIELWVENNDNNQDCEIVKAILTVDG